MWSAILDICAGWLNSFSNLVGDCGLAIIIVTLVIRLILFPFQRKQYKSSFAMKEMQPKIQRIQEIYAGDQQKISEETMKIYQEVHFNPLSGCLPMLVQMPVFIILFQVLRRRLDTFDLTSFYGIIPDLNVKITEAWGHGIAYSIPYIIFFVWFVAASVVPMAIQMKQQSGSQNGNQTKIMMVFMGLMFLWMGWISPGGVLLYWSISSSFAACQQIITNKQLSKKKQIEEDIKEPVKPVQVNVVRKEKKKRPTKKH